MQTLEATISQFQPFDMSTTTQPEQAFVINNNNGSVVIGPIVTLATTGGSLNTAGGGPNTIYTVHTHTNGGYPFPSPADFFSLAEYNSSNFQIAYVIAYDGTKYAMVVNNFTILRQFVTNNPDAINSNAGFDIYSPLGERSESIKANLIAQGYSSEEAYERTLAFLMKEAGVTLVKASPGSNNFRKIGLQQKKNADGSPVVDSNGKILYENADCS